MKEEYATFSEGRLAFAHFNEQGTLDIYYVSDTRYCYEIPCDTTSPIRYTAEYRWFSSELSWGNCFDLHRYLWQIADQFLQPSYNGMYDGLLGKFCYSNDNYQPFPYKGALPNKYKNYRIRASKFYAVGEDGKKHFKSPTLADYKRMVAKQPDFIDDGTEEYDYLYDYWQ